MKLGKKNIKILQTILFSFLFCLVIISSFYLNNQLPAFFSRANNEPFQPQTLSYLGFNTQLRINDPANSGLAFAAFTKLVDTLDNESISQKTIRLGIPVDEIFPRTTMSSTDVICSNNNGQLITNCDPDVLQQVSEALEYASSKNIKIIAVTHVPSWALTYSSVPEQNQSWQTKLSSEDYRSLAQKVHHILQSELGTKVDVWNVFNESNIYAFDSHQPVSPVNYQSYLDQFSPVFDAIESELRTGNENVKITHDVASIHLSNDPQFHDWEFFLNFISNKVDILSFNLYPAKDERLVLDYKNELRQLSATFQKPIMITETGFYTQQPMSQSDQAEYLPYIINSLLDSEALSGLLVYEYQDDLTYWYDDQAKSYGIVSGQKTNKLAYSNVLAALKGQYSSKTPYFNLNCQPLMIDSFDQPSGTTINWSNWSGAGNAYQESESSLTLKQNDWLIAAPEMTETFQVSMDLNNFSINQDWGAIDMQFLDGSNNQSLYEAVVLKESWGYTLRLIHNGVIKNYYVSDQLNHLNSLSLNKVGQRMYFSYQNSVLGEVSELFLTDLPVNTVKIGIIIKGAPQANTSIDIDSMTISTCQVKI